MEEIKYYGIVYRLSFPNGNYIGHIFVEINITKSLAFIKMAC